MTYKFSRLLCYSAILSISIVPSIVFAETPPPKPISFHVNEFNLDGDSPIAKEEMDKLLASFDNKDYDLADLQQVSKQVEKAIRDAGFAFYRVILPAQNVADGTVKLKLVSFTLAEININNNKHFNNDNILRTIPHLKTGVSPNTQALAEQIKVANHHPNKDINVIFKQSQQADKIDAKVDVNESKPYQFALLANNSGNRETGKARVTGAFQHTNLWNKDHIANASYTTSPNHVSEVSQYALSYSLPIYSTGGWLNAYYSQSDVETGRIAIAGGDLDVAGAGKMFGLHYQQYFRKVDNYEHSIDVGFDNRYFDNTAILTVNNVNRGDISPDIRSTPLTLTYKGNFNLNSLIVGHNISWSKNLKMGGDNDQQAYDDLSFATGQGLASDWEVFRYGFYANKTIDKWLLRASLKGQYTNEPVISGEQFGLGGAYSIRGYDEREVSTDIGKSLTLEAYTPKWNNLNLVGFYDYGEGRVKDALPNSRDSWNLASIGVGVRWQYKSYVQASIDLARTLRPGPSTAEDQYNAHASIALFY